MLMKKHYQHQCEYLCEIADLFGVNHSELMKDYREKLIETLPSGSEVWEDDED